MYLNLLDKVNIRLIGTYQANVYTYLSNYARRQRNKFESIGFQKKMFEFCGFASVLRFILCAEC